MRTLLDAGRIERIICDLAGKIVADPFFSSQAGGVDGSAGGVALVGIRSRGEILAQRLAGKISELQRAGAGGAGAGASVSATMPIDLGALDITFYRDDLSARRAITIPQGTDLNFRLDDRAVILVDDVLATGRSVRAALDALVDFGRPRLIRLAVLVDRGGRELPIAADFVGMQVTQMQRGQKITVHLKPTDVEDAVYLE